MSDDLVKRLRHLGDHASFEPHMHHTAADRIEELEDKLDWVLVERDETFALMLDRAQTAEAKLAKAVEALGILADDTNWFDAVEEDGTFSPAWRGTGTPDEIARTTLKELTGGKDE